MTNSSDESQTPPYDLAGYRDVPAYIYGITRAIWEDRGIGGRLDDYYASDIKVRAPTGLTCGNRGVVAQTLGTLHQFPDRELVGEDVIWTATPQRGFLSSHRLVSVMTHTGDGSYGPAAHRPVRSRIIADCWVQDGKVKEEWLVRDQGAFARCLGLTAEQLARQMQERSSLDGRAPAFFTPEQDQPSRYIPVVASDPAVTRHAELLQQIWTVKELAAIRRLYFAGANLHAPGNETLYGHRDIDRFVVSYLAAFPDAQLEVHSATVNREPERPIRIALRWSLTGTHEGFGRFGAPSGARVYIMCMSHVHVTDGLVRSEWLAVDEVAIWTQILAHRSSK
jgi:predicted ester cyclase